MVWAITFCNSGTYCAILAANYWALLSDAFCPSETVRYPSPGVRIKATPAMELRVADVGLKEGEELEYLYDFGDSLRHTLVLKMIGNAERRVNYPRVVK